MNAPGRPVDASGAIAADPTANVLALVDAAERRLDDLLIAAERLSAVKHAHSRELIQVHADHARDLRDAETKRLDAIREVDVAAASVIANQVATSAETLRTLVSTTATTLAAQAASSFGQLSDRIAQLERTSYEGSGKSEGGKESRSDARLSVGMVVGIIGVAVAFIMLVLVIMKGLG